MRTEIGHFSIEYDSVTYELYPTFKNMRKLCDPKQMPDFFSGLFGRETQATVELISCVGGNIYAENIGKKLIYKSINRIYEDAAFLLQCCCEDDISKLTGFASYDKGRKAWRAGVMNIDNVLSIARALITHGVVGQPKEGERTRKGKATDTIDVYSYVEAAMAHLNMSYSDAERLTKTEFDRLIDAKYPDAKNAKEAPPTMDEHKSNMAMLKEINARRDNKGAK
tara:strand:+ start:1243 stop:1914 length:672 start_codon:yes stop_codon:yes gene_type:complete